MKAYIFFSVHEELFHRMAVELRPLGMNSFSGFVWGTQIRDAIVGKGITYDPLVVFSRDLLPKANDGAKPDLEWLAKRERELGVSIQRMLTAERHLLAGRSFDQIMRLAEVALREIADALDRAKPDLIFSEDISCFHSLVHFALAQERGIPFWAIGSGRLPRRVSVYKSGPIGWEKFEQTFADIRQRGLTAEERARAESYLKEFLERPARPTGMAQRSMKPGIKGKDALRFGTATKRYLGDPDDPTVISPWRQVQRRLVRMERVAMADARGVFEKPVEEEKYVLYPIHFQPEASTLVQGPMYLDQVVLLRDIAASLPIGYRLYVKEHLSNRGRRPLSFYNAIKALPAARLLGPDEDTWELIRNANMIAVITGTMGWEGVLFGKPVITFGSVFFNAHPSVLRAGDHSKDAWYQLFQRASANFVSDREATLAMIAALQTASYPGFIGSPGNFPEVLEPENLRQLTHALADGIGLTK